MGRLQASCKVLNPSFSIGSTRRIAANGGRRQWSREYTLIWASAIFSQGKLGRTLQSSEGRLLIIRKVPDGVRELPRPVHPKSRAAASSKIQITFSETVCNSDAGSSEQIGPVRA